MEEPRGSHRTRSKAAPDWTVDESLILVNEINAIESEWGDSLPSFQKWQQIVDNCNILDVNRNLNQCKRKWESLLSEYRSVKNGSAKNGSLHGELFEVIDSCVNVNGKKLGSAEMEEEVEVDAVVPGEEQALMDTVPDSDSDANGYGDKFSLEKGSKKQRRTMKRRRRRIESRNPWGYFTSPESKCVESSNINDRLENTNRNTPEEITADSKELIMSAILQENVLQINAILEGNLADDIDYKLADLKNAEAVQTDFARRQGDEIVDFLGKISSTLIQLCDFIQRN